jgi:SAM-dependent methyltransferase
VAEAEAAPVQGWDFSWLDGRATEERPPWGYAARVVDRLGGAGSVLDLQTGGGEVFAEILGRARPAPARAAATEGWPTNQVLARERLEPLGVTVAGIADDDPLPFPDRSLDLIVSRHPTVVRFDEVARTLAPTGRYLAQHIGPGSNRELTDFLMGPQPVSDLRSAGRAVREAEAAGLEVLDLREATLEVAFFDIGAVVWFLRKVVWAVPGFTVARYRPRLEALHRRMEAGRPFVSHATRFLLEAAPR